MSEFAIEATDVSKKFKYWSDKPASLKTLLIDALTLRLSAGKKTEFTVLENLNFQIRKGEFVGIMGKNGAGKSTLLKMLSRIYWPSSGSLTVNEKIAPLIELGAGFHGELSGYENIFLNASILGFSKAETEKQLDSILAFADIGDRIHMPVKKYSSGMLVRLGFAVATHLNAPILLIDEVLAVGDIDFQKKCLEKIKSLHLQGRTIILVTHDPVAVENYCSRCIVIADRKKVFDGDPKSGAQVYRNG